MEVNEHGQLAVDHPDREVLVVLNVEGDPPAGGVREGARQSVRGREEGSPGCAGLRGRGGKRRGGGGGWEAADALRRERPHSAHKQPVSHLRERREEEGNRGRMLVTKRRRREGGTLTASLHEYVTAPSVSGVKRFFEN